MKQAGEFVGIASAARRLQSMQKLCALVALVGLSLTSFGQITTNTWVKWESPSFDKTVDTGDYGTIDYASVVTGTLYNVNNAATVNVTYTGEATQWSAFNGSGLSGVVDMWGNSSTYLNSSVTTAPTYGNYIALSGYSRVTNTLTFSAPVQNILMSIASLGSPGTQGSYEFNQPFITLSSGPGQWGSGTMTGSGTTTLTGLEGDGIIEFIGTFSSLTWTTPDPEAYSAFNIGISSVTVVPEPTSCALLGVGACLAMLRRKWKRVSVRSGC